MSRYWNTGNGRFFSLRTKLLLFATAIVLIPGGIYGAITLSSSRAALAQVVGRLLVEEAREGADRLATTLRSERERLESFATQDVMREIRIEDLDKRISSFLASAKRGCPSCVDFLVLDRNGRVVASSNPSWIGETEALIPGGPSIGEAVQGPFQAPGSVRTLLRFTVPVPDPEAPQALIGRLVALFDWERSTDVLTRMRESLVSVDFGTDMLILDARGIVIGGTARPSGPWQLGNTVALQPLNVEERSTTGYIDSAAGMLIGHARLPDDLPSWTIVVAESLANAFAPAHRMVKLLATTLASTLLIALAIALLAARRVTRPLAELTGAAEAVGRGLRPESAVPVRSRDEIGTLTEAFNRMAADLKRVERELVDAAKFSFVGELAAGVAHEVRTPLGVLRSSAQLLERSLEVKDEDSRELLQLLQNEVARIERVVSALIDLGRPREMHPEPSFLSQILFRTTDFVDAQARQKHVTIHRRAIDPDPVVLCDPELIHQVALNLLVNAVQILPDGGTIEIGILPARNGYAGFEVRDDGPGMTQEVCTRIFEPYFTRREGGSGLGLTFVQRVVQEHRGRVLVESTLGHGTVFRVTLPVAKSFR
ncbi:MAG: HAMP domain-containing protein [Deltaproteobacteria bacterium]|nr:HAMP domain-containing protein [Deltaproteobacteria bacterium]